MQHGHHKGVKEVHKWESEGSVRAVPAGHCSYNVLKAERLTSPKLKRRCNYVL